MSKSESTAVMSVEERIRQDIANQSGRLPTSGGNRVKTSDKKFTFPDGSEFKGKPIEVVILDYINTKTLYAGAYNPKNISPPICAASAVLVQDLRPNADIKDPVSTTCAECPKNQWGSGNGNGKECTDKIIVAFLRPDALDGEIYTIEASPTAIKGFTKYVKGLQNAGKTLPMIITSIGFSDDAFPSIRFTAAAPNPGIAEAYGRQEEATKLLKE